jgi:malonate transporter and related proteins
VIAIANSVVPLFAVIFLGYFAGRAGFLGESGIRGLGAFVFNFAIPPHVFRLMAQTELDRITEWLSRAQPPAFCVMSTCWP